MTKLCLFSATNDEHNSQVNALKEQIRLFLARRFGASSEKVSPDQTSLFNEAESLVEEDEAETDQHNDREECVHDLPEEEKTCPHDGSVLKMIGSDDHEQLDIIPAQIKVIRHRRLKYACPCCDQHIVTAKKPKQAINKSIASPGLLAFVATQKYCDALPLYRQSNMFKRIGIELDRTNLANWMFSKSQAGAKASANLYSLVETAKANSVNPYEYLKHVFTELPNRSREDDLADLLPWNVTLS